MRFTSVTYEAQLPTITGKNTLHFEKGKDGIKHLSEYLERDEAMKEEVFFCDRREKFI